MCAAKATLFAFVAVAALAISSSQARAATAKPAWLVTPIAQPTHFREGDEGAAAEARTRDEYHLRVTNIGGAASSGTVEIVDTLPADVTAVQIEGEAALPTGSPFLTCNSPPATSVKCTFAAAVPTGAALTVEIYVNVGFGLPASVLNLVEVSGGGAPTVSTSEQTQVSTTQPSFDIDGFAFGIDDVSGATDTQAADHPNLLTTSFNFTTVHTTGASGAYPPVEDVKDVVVDLPLGFVGDPQAAPQCPASSLAEQEGVSLCPTSSQVGVFSFQDSGGTGRELLPIYNMAPEDGYPAAFGINYQGRGVLMYATPVPTPLGYDLSVAVPGIPETSELTGLSLSFFGDPAVEDGGGDPSAAFITNPADCSTAPLPARIEADSWENPGMFVSGKAEVFPQITGCDMLQFPPTLEVAPEPQASQADTPAGYEVDLKVPQAPNLAPVLATPDLKDATVTLPAGVSLSPAAADGLQGCGEQGPEGIDLGAMTPLEGQAPGSPVARPAPGHCPQSSKIGTVELETPLLAPHTLTGSVYLAEPACGGAGQSACGEASATNGELYGLYIELQGDGVVIKLKGEVEANPATGQLTTHFDENPQLPFNELKLRLKGGPRAPLANPQSCGTFTTTSILEPWSAPETADATPSSSFAIDGCAGAMPFAPTFSAGTVTPSAGDYSPFTLTFARHDGEQDLGQVTVHTPPGLLGKIAGIPQCPEAQANAGTCSAASRIGTVNAAAGSGSHPFWVSGPVYLTGPYKGAPFGLSVVVPAQAGPFNLGNEIVRSAISVDPSTAALTVVSNPLPQKLDGVPFRLKTVNVSIDRPGFMFNPTNCTQMQLAGSISGDLENGAPDSTVGVSSLFAVAGCAKLPFKPAFSVSTQAKTSKADGASLTVKITQKPGESDIQKVDLQLPKVLPSRLTTLHQACTEAQFAANPAGCPEGSVIGTAVAVTPLLNVPLSGPAYLVSHGGAAFPDVEFVLQGEGVEIVLDGKTDIKKGITYSNFETVPDAPISSFETRLPEGPHSILTANAALCGQALAMPTKVTGQNGAQILQSTRIGVSGCGKPTIKIKKIKIKANGALVTIVTSQYGTVAIGGGGLKTITRTLGAGSHQIKLALTKAGRAARKLHRKVKVKASVKGPNGSSSKTVNFKF
ncbi:MAG TPA: hypothetical protein VGL54_01550 [Solirubrobacteraceae bacterium]|jgi:hypothetical protein